MKTAARNGKNTAEEERKRKKGRGGKEEKERKRRKGREGKDEEERNRRKGREGKEEEEEKRKMKKGTGEKEQSWDCLTVEHSENSERRSTVRNCKLRPVI